MRDSATIPAFGGCCAGGLAASADRAAGTGDAERWARPAEAGALRVDLMVPGISCAACIRTIETGLGGLEGVITARVNLTLRRVRVLFDPSAGSVAAVLQQLAELGYEARPYDAAAMAAIDRDGPGRDLLARLAVAGFAAMNVMLLSISVWAGAEAAMRDMLHWISALIALPAIAFAGMPFFRSALGALAARRLNMDVPISLAVCLSAGTSLYETANGGAHAYFDAGISLLFFLLIGRYLDHRTRALARSAAAELTALSARAATVIWPGGRRSTVAIEDIAPGALVEVVPGERVPADGQIEAGASDLDRSMVTGETNPEPVAPGAQVHAGMLNLSGPLKVRVTATGEATLLAEIARMIESAERGKTRYDRWADQAARIYVPGVHLVSAAAFVGWLWATGDWRLAVTIATAVLIITCPCALGLAVPAVHAVAGGRLFRRGIFLKDVEALERLARADMVVFDKTGTLTDGRPVLASGPRQGEQGWPVAAALAATSRHPLSRALAEAAKARKVVPATITCIREIPGSGIEGVMEGLPVRLGRAAWVGAEEGGETAVWLQVGTAVPVAFTFEDAPRIDAAEVCAALRARGLELALFSGDAAMPVKRVAEATGIETVRPGLNPAQKLAALNALARDGRRVLMVGDGLNDAPALAAADVSMSPVAASDVSRAAAGLVFTGARLAPVIFAIDMARKARRRALENFGLAALYNAIAVPVALTGMVTPLIAALAMSGSSILVTLNALRLRGVR